MGEIALRGAFLSLGPLSAGENKDGELPAALGTGATGVSADESERDKEQWQLLDEKDLQDEFV